jgi:hypothetical protein
VPSLAGNRKENGPLTRPVCTAATDRCVYTIQNIAITMNTVKKIAPKIAPRRQ